MKIPRVYRNLDKILKPNKVLVLYGPRQVGKTTLLENFLTQTKLKYRLESGDSIKTESIFNSNDIETIQNYAEGYDLIAIDEAQQIRGIGQGLKILVDHVPGIKVIVTGSSSFELAGQIGEPLTGRKNTILLFPISTLELQKLYNAHEQKELLPERLIFGNYPEVVSAKKRSDKIQLLEELVHSYLLKDILELERVKGSKLLLDLLRLLAFQVGNEVSLSELAQKLGIDYKTVGRYIDLFEKAFVIYNLRGFSRNLHNEITNKSKYYFYDTGIRNAIISNFNPLDLRNDIGALWENFVVMERLKKRSYTQIPANDYFWRNWQQQEIDLIEEREGKLFGYECKWQKTEKKAPKAWLEAYPESEYAVIHPENFMRFVA